MHFLAMAETLRRAAEWKFAQIWPEEDEIGPGQWMPGARKMLYGSERVFDARSGSLRDYLNLLGLDFAKKVRCYVEGETELGALEHAVGSFDHIQLVNLRGSVVEKRGKGLAFANSLESDKSAGIFSVVILDGDCKENIRVLRQSAAAGQFHGRFFICEPDFECGNFTGRELIAVLIRDLERNGAAQVDWDGVESALLLGADSIKSGTDLFAFFRSYGVTQARKSASWGRTLMQYAIEYPLFPADHPKVGEQRPIVELADLLIKIRNIGFGHSLSLEQLDPKTGKMLPRDTKILQ